MPDRNDDEPSALALGRNPRRPDRRGGPALIRRPDVLLLLALIVISLVFLTLPGIDLSVSRAFTNSESRFFLASYPALRMLRDLGNALTVLVVATALAAMIVPLLSPVRRFVLRAHEAAYVLAVYAVGPGLIVNAIMKNAFGRPRPVSLVEFGGNLRFSPIWTVGGGCLRNCSFAAGEGAAAAALLCLVFVTPRRYRLATGLVLLAVAAAVSVDRIAFGGHFLSDVLVSWAIVLLVALGLRPLFFGDRAARIDAIFGRRSLFRAGKR